MRRHRVFCRACAAGALLCGLSSAALAFAQGVPAIITVEGVQPPEQAPPPPPDPQIAETVTDEIVITGEHYGKARVEAETEFGEETIAAHGADSIQELLKKLAPLIDPNGEEPIILINGEPAGYDQSILGYPPEALRRLDVLKPEAATEYGQPAGKRVINLVLKRSFSSFNADVGADWPTAGGKSGQRLSVARTAISGRTRWNANARLSRDSALWKNHRNVQRREGVFDRRGVVIGLGGGEIDPALSLLVGRPVNFAGLALSDGASLADFAALADQRDDLDPARYETLSPNRENASLSIGMTRPLGRFNLSLNVNANLSNNESFRGPAMANMIWRETDAASPFSQNVRIIRPVDGLHALRSAGESQSLGGSLSLNGNVAGWQGSFGLNFNHSRNENRLENGVSDAALQAAFDAGEISPFAALGPEWIASTRNKGQNENLSAQFMVQRGVLTLPAGDISLSMGANGSMGSSRNIRWVHDDDAREDRSKRKQGSAQASLNIPINRDRQGLLPLPVNLSIDLSAGANQSSGGRVQRRWSVGGNLEPVPWLQLRGSMDGTDMAPAFEQLDGVIDQQIERVFDYARQEVAEVIWVTGGNPNLRRGRQQSLSLNAMVRPFGPNGASMNFGYRRSESMNAISALPDLTPVVEAAFPDRIFRDAEGRLVRVDARSINLESDSNSSLNSGLTIRWPQTPDPNSGDRAWQLQASINHRMQLSAERKIRDGLPVIDLLGGDSGQSRHNVSSQITASRRGLGTTVSGNWSSGGRLRAIAGELGGLRFKPPLSLNFSAFLEPDRLWAGAKDSRIWKGLRISFDVQNVTNSYRRVLRDDGTAPPGYGRDDVDPLGRTMRVQLRKKF